jgi:hypothetical protein
MIHIKLQQFLVLLVGGFQKFPSRFCSGTVFSMFLVVSVHSIPARLLGNTSQDVTCQFRYNSVFQWYFQDFSLILLSVPQKILRLSPLLSFLHSNTMLPMPQSLQLNDNASVLGKNMEESCYSLICGTNPESHRNLQLG